MIETYRAVRDLVRAGTLYLRDLEVFVVIATLASDPGGCVADNRTLADRLGLKTRSTIGRALHRLDAQGFIRRVVGPDGHRRIEVIRIVADDAASPPATMEALPC